MRKQSFLLLLLSITFAAPAGADPFNRMRSAEPVLTARDFGAAPGPERVSHREESNLGGGFIEFLFTGRSYDRRGREQQGSFYLHPGQELERRSAQPPAQMVHFPRGEPTLSEAARPAFDPRFERRVVDYPTQEKPGTVVIDTGARFLYLVQEDGKAIRYGVGVGRPGFDWKGVKAVSAKREWPDWTPPPEMLQRRPDLPVWMAGGPENPLGARAIYLGSSLYRIHGSNEPHTIGQAVSSGCFRMRNQDVIDLYEKVKVGTKVVVI